MYLFIFLLSIIEAYTNNKDRKLYGSYIDKDIVIITRDRCGYSTRMREFLDQKKIDYKDINVSKKGYNVIDDLKLEGLTFPMVFLNKAYIGGYDDSMNNQDLKDKIEKMQGNEKTEIEKHKFNQKKLYIKY